jgi:hypothetical protein
MTRDEHLAWAKARALEYVDRGNLAQAVSSLTSDMQKHDETTPRKATFHATAAALYAAADGNADLVRRWVEGWK